MAKRFKLYLVRGIAWPLALGCLLWIAMPFLADKRPNSGYEGLLATIDAVKLAPLLFVCVVINCWMLLLPPVARRPAQTERGWTYVAGLFPVLVVWALCVFLISDADWGKTNLDLLLKSK